MFSYLPSVLNTWQLPGLAAGALSSALQRRILLYLLKRTLGHLIKDNELKLDQIDASTVGGKIEVRAVHLDAGAVTALLPDLACRLDAGLVGNISITLPWPNLMTGDLIISISDLSLSFVVDGSGRREAHSVSLTDSLVSAAEEIMHQDSEGMELEESIQASIIEETSASDGSEVPTNSYVAGIVESLLARVKVSVHDLCIGLRHDDAKLPEVQLRVAKIQASTTPVAPGSQMQELIRTATVEGIGVYLRTNTTSAVDGQGGEADSSDEEGGSESDYMAMSQAIPDLRSSRMGSQSFCTSASGAESLYASALGGDEEAGSGIFSARQALLPSEQLLAKVDGEPSVVRLVAAKPSLAGQGVSQRDDPAGGSESDDRDGGSESDDRDGATSHAFSLTLSIEVGNLVSFLDPDSTCALLRLSEDCIATLRRDKDEDAVGGKPRRGGVQPRLVTSLAIKGLDFVCAYESAASLGPTRHDAFLQSLQSYWSRPPKVHPDIGHLRLRIQTIRCRLLSYGSESSAEVQVGDASIYEHLSPSLTDDCGGRHIATTLPLLLFDHNLTEQYVPVKGQTSGSGLSFKPEGRPDDVSIDAIDWRIPTGGSTAQDANAKAGPYWRAGYGDRGWKVRPKHRRSSSTATSRPDSIPVLTCRLDGLANVQVSLAPIHLFADLSTFDRVLSLLKSLGKNTRADLAGSMQSDLTASFETLHQASVGSLSDSKGPSMSLCCDLIRVEVRVPSSAPQPHLSGPVAHKRRLLGLQVRAGIVMVDARSVGLRLGSDEAGAPKARVHFDSFGGPQRMPINWQQRQEEATICSVDQLTLFYKPVDQQRAANFALLGMLSSDEGLEKPLAPRVKMLKEDQQGSATVRSFVDCRLPCLNVCMSKQLLDGLELMADDFALWSSSLGQEQDDQDSSSESATDALKILGSRFFGTKHSISALSGSSASMELTRKSDSTPAFSLSVSEIYLSLLVPTRQVHQSSRQVCLSASELKLFVDTQHGPRSTLVDVTVLSLSVEEETEANQRLKLVSRTLQPSLSRGVVPMLSVQLLSTADQETNYRESKCEMLLQGLTLTFHGDLSLFTDLLVFSRSPDGAFEHVEPNEVTRLQLRIRDVSVCVAPLSCQARAVVLIGDFALRTKLMPDAHQTTIRGALRDSTVMVTEKKEEEGLERQSRLRSSLEYWTSCSFVKVALLSDIVGSITLSSLTRPEVDVKATRVVVEGLVCADTLDVINDLASHVIPSSLGKEGREAESAVEEGDTADRDLMASVDQDAFVGAKPVASLPDFLDDDVPRHPEYLKSDAPWSDGQEEGEMSLEEKLMMEDDDIVASQALPLAGVVLQTEAVTIRLLDGRGIAPKADYLGAIEARAAATAPRRSSSLRVRVQGCDVTLRLFAGYDCHSTRTSVEEEARRVRRRLQKIKQMLDQGQTPDDSVEEATASLLDSVHIPLPEGGAVGEMGVGELMQAMDDGLGDQSETASSASTWKQFIPGRPGPLLPSQQKRKRSKLMRSKNSLIDVELRAISMEYDLYSPNDPLASRLLFQAKSLQILDNIKTSTWHTFLTEMAPGHSFLPRNAKDMVRVEITNVRPSKQSSQVEVRCRARLSPIRLHVDQDALDFLKKFAGFKAPNAMPKGPKPASREPFIQHAEVFPIRIKLDYKPKRVDYSLLREGKTIELMNFFNFEGSEMTLRHITIRGISGWTRFFDTLQDIWTPDVKSNQLADVLSGISPIRSLVNVGNGMADLVLLPIEQYQRDGRLSKGLKAGAKSFVKSTMLEAARIGARLATGTQVILEQAETALGARVDAQPSRSGSSSGSSIRRQERRHGDEGDDDEGGAQTESDEEVGPRGKISRYANQPDNLIEALNEAQQGLSKGFNEAAQTILAVPMEVYERRGGEGGSRPVVRAVPIAVLKGAAGASGAVGKTLQGIQRELAGASLEEEEDKYKKGRAAR